MLKMAAPQIAGAVAVMKEYIQKNIEKFDESSQGGKENTINGSFASSMNIDNIVEALLMSTANPQTQKDTYNTANGRELLYSPRKQGAGLADIGKALSTEAYLFNTNNEENQRPVINYGESEGGTFTQSFQLRNMSDESIRFALESIIETEHNIYSKGTRIIVNAPYRLNGKSTIEINSHNAKFVSGSAIGENVSPVSGCVIEIQPDTTVELTLTIELTDEDKKYINDNYPNGEFVEGYLKFKALSEHAVDLNIPFLGFYGLWGKAPILDTTLYEYNESGVIPTIATYYLSSFEMTRLIGIVPYTSPGILSPTLGKNFLSSSSDAYSKYISISPNGDGYYDQFVLAYCSSRNTTKTDCYIKLKDGTVVYEQHQGGSRKSTVIKGILRNNYITLD